MRTHDLGTEKALEGVLRSEFLGELFVLLGVATRRPFRTKVPQGILPRLRVPEALYMGVDFRPWNLDLGRDRLEVEVRRLHRLHFKKDLFRYLRKPMGASEAKPLLQPGVAKKSIAFLALLSPTFHLLAL